MIDKETQRDHEDADYNKGAGSYARMQPDNAEGAVIEEIELLFNMVEMSCVLSNICIK